MSIDLNPAKAIFHEVENVGRRIASSKRKSEWTFAFNDDEKDTKIHKIILKDSLVSGKKEVFVDGELKLTNKKKLSKFEFPFTIGSHLLRITTPKMGVYDLVIDNVSFTHLVMVSETDVLGVETGDLNQFIHSPSHIAQPPSNSRLRAPSFSGTSSESSLPSFDPFKDNALFQEASHSPATIEKLTEETAEFDPFAVSSSSQQKKQLAQQQQNQQQQQHVAFPSQQQQQQQPQKSVQQQLDDFDVFAGVAVKTASVPPRATEVDEFDPFAMTDVQPISKNNPPQKSPVMIDVFQQPASKQQRQQPIIPPTQQFGSLEGIVDFSAIRTNEMINKQAEVKKVETQRSIRSTGFNDISPFKTTPKPISPLC
eukprot:TRINITY_DN156_c0_g4_i1.p1 TRINITY_DN156_c0_g4~~TRINITY_DN156_c0_g4_i1.p1  ORF type:complete len:368 (-),score=168.84 TRINITY_DN156_c0_g4_i1:862-1965(-)